MKTITLEIGEHWFQLCKYGTKNFIADQPDRFVLAEGPKNTKGFMYGCATYLEAKVLAAYLGTKTIYFDEEDSDSGFVVIDTQPGERIKANED